jgi:hypothetical protein
MAHIPNAVILKLNFQVTQFQPGYHDLILIIFNSRIQTC